MSESSQPDYTDVVRATLGFEGRMISYSKSGYFERHPEHVAIFNANVCVARGEVWHGDLDLTIDEPVLQTLASRIVETVYVLYESDARFDHESHPLLDRAVFSITPSGHTQFDYRYLVRAEDGSLRHRPPKPIPHARWRWRVLRHRPRLLRFWIGERRRTEEYRRGSLDRTALLYVGARDNGKTPLLVLTGARGSRLRKLAFEAIWYPGHETPRNAPRPLVHIQPTVEVTRLALWLGITVWPGNSYALNAGYALKAKA